MSFTANPSYNNSMISAHASHPGLVRQNNEDSICTDDSLGIYLLADGIGGNNAGEVASAMGVEAVCAVLRANIAHTAVDGYFELMIHAIQTAHWKINTKALTDLSMAKMGTTLVVAVVREHTAYIAHAGDSRCYLLQGYNSHSVSSRVSPKRQKSEGNRLTRLTHDHTVGDQMLASGVAVSRIPKKKFHTLTQAVGCGNPPYPDFTIVDFKPGDLFLICSDGLTDMLTDAEIEAVLANDDASLDALVNDLIDAANAHGGRDNVSVILIATS
jgi:protein phosphatase